MNRFFVLFGVLSMISCQQENNSLNKNVLFNINHSNKLKIVSIDAKCGEWGGDEKQIVFYRDDFKSQLLANYLEKNKNCDHIPESKITKSIKRIKITDEDSDLIIKIMVIIPNLHLFVKK